MTILEMLDSSLLLTKNDVIRTNPMMNSFYSEKGYKYLYTFIPSPPKPPNTETEEEKKEREKNGKNLIVTFQRVKLKFGSLYANVNVSELKPRIALADFRSQYANDLEDIELYDIGFGFSTGLEDTQIDSYKATGEGNAPVIFGTVKNAILRFLQKEPNISGFFFEAMDLERDDKIFVHRKDLYDLFARIIVKETPFHSFIHDKDTYSGKARYYYFLKKWK